MPVDGVLGRLFHRLLLKPLNVEDKDFLSSLLHKKCRAITKEMLKDKCDGIYSVVVRVYRLLQSLV